MAKKGYGLGDFIVTAVAVALAIALCFGYFNQSAKDNEKKPGPSPTSHR